MNSDSLIEDNEITVLMYIRNNRAHFENKIKVSLLKYWKEGSDTNIGNYQNNMEKKDSIEVQV